MTEFVFCAYRKQDVKECSDCCSSFSYKGASTFIDKLGTVKERVASVAVALP